MASVMLAEEYEPFSRRMLGNFPQGFSHIGVVNTAFNLASALGPAKQRAEATAPHDDATAPDNR